MEQAFIQQIRDVKALEDLVKRYMGSRAFSSVQAEIVALNWRSVHDKSNKKQAQLSPIRMRLRDIIRHGYAGPEDERFRLLIIGKSGSGRTTVLNKVRVESKT
jgi:hypothetical protein